MTNPVVSNTSLLATSFLRWIILPFIVFQFLSNDPGGLIPSAHAEDCCWDAFDMSNPDEIHIVAFCEQALLTDRGLIISPFIGGSDQRILTYQLHDEKFRKALNSTGDTTDFTDFQALNETLKIPPSGENDLPYLGRSSTSATQELFQKISPDEQKRLPGLYLRLEGLSALVRPDFAKLFEKPETVQKIEALAKKYAEPAGRYHLRLFSSPPLTDDDLTICASRLRRLSADLDIAILCILTPLERQRVVTLLRKSSDLQPLIRQPPRY